MTWVSGMTLLAIVYYYNAKAMMIDPSVYDLTPTTAIIIGVASGVLSWFIYDLLCKALKSKPLLLGIIIFIYLAALAYLLSQFLSPRAAYIHVGAAIGTIIWRAMFSL